MTFGNQYVPGVGYSSSNATGETMSFGPISHYDATAGFSFNSSAGDNNEINYYFGAAAFHLLQPKEAFDATETFVKLPIKYDGNLGVHWTINNNIGITAAFNYFNQHPYQEIIGGGLVSWSYFNPKDTRLNFSVYAGAFYRVGDAIIPTFKIDYQNYSLTVSYDINNSTLSTASNGNGGVEMSFYVRGLLHFKQNKLACPRFEQMMPGFSTDDHATDYDKGGNKKKD